MKRLTARMRGCAAQSRAGTKHDIRGQDAPVHGRQHSGRARSGLDAHGLVCPRALDTDGLTNAYGRWKAGHRQFHARHAAVRAWTPHAVEDGNLGRVSRLASMWHETCRSVHTPMQEALWPLPG